MDSNDTCLIGEPDALNIFKTLYLFLQNHNFPKSAETLLDEWGLVRSDIAKIPNKSLYLAKCGCSNTKHHQANQTDSKTFKNGWEGDTSATTDKDKPHDDTHLFFVCDCERRKGQCCQQNRLNHGFDLGRGEPTDVKKLKQKFGQLQEEHQKLIAVTGELTTALQTNIIGQTKSIYTVLNHCKTIYPSLFDFDESELGNNKDQAADTDSERDENSSDIQLEVARSDVMVEEPQTDSVARSVQLPDPSDINKHQKHEKREQDTQRDVEPFNFDRLSASPPVVTAPLTPETVRYVLEMVFDRIFEIEKAQAQSPKGDHEKTTTTSSPPPLSRNDVEKIVGEVLMETVSPSPTLGAGEGEHINNKNKPEEQRVCDGFFHVDFAKLKNDLIHGDDEKKIRLLQALRWRITKNDTTTRGKVLDSYIANDIFDLNAPISIPERSLLGYGTDQYVQEGTCRLINTLASLKQGRDYLTMEKRLLRRVLIKKVKDIRHIIEPVIRNMLVASVQKLSIRKQCRTQMVTDGLFEALVDYLDDFFDKLSKYCLEYCSALLMNLCLVDEAKVRATKNIKRVVSLLRKCLQAGDGCCLPYINGVMFSLFEKDVIVEEAMRQNLDKLIIHLVQTSNNDNTKKQLEFVLQSRLFGKSEPTIRHSDEDSKEEVDLLEVELDQDDFYTKLPSGEQLLQLYKTDFIVERDGNPVIKQSPILVPINLRKDPPNSAMSFSEDTKRFYHKPSCDNGIFEAEKQKSFRFGPSSQNLIRNYMKNKLGQNSARLPATPLCYMENCQRLEKGNAAMCTCSKCLPNQSRYSCGCYDAIRQDVDDVAVEVDVTEQKSRIEKKQLSEIKIVVEGADDVINDGGCAIKQSGGNKPKSGCKVCGERKCECAFESRPKITRTPPK